MCAMVPGAPEKSRQEFWGTWGERIRGLVKEAFLRTSGPRSCEAYSDEVVEKMKTKYSGHEISPSEVTDIPPLVDMHVRKFIALKREQLWKTHRAFVVSAVQEALPSPLR